jgi:hypothetical protein
VIDLLLAVDTALVGAQLEVRLAAPAVHGAEHDLLAIGAGGSISRYPLLNPYPVVPTSQKAAHSERPYA